MSLWWLPRMRPEPEPEPEPEPGLLARPLQLPLVPSVAASSYNPDNIQLIVCTRAPTPWRALLPAD